MKIGDLVKHRNDGDLALAIDVSKRYVTLMWLDDGELDRCAKILMDPWEVIDESRRPVKC